MRLQIRASPPAVDVLHVPVEVGDGDGCQVPGVDLDMVPGGELDRRLSPGFRVRWEKDMVRKGSGLAGKALPWLASQDPVQQMSRISSH